jgi:hypothetical protein
MQILCNLAAVVGGQAYLLASLGVVAAASTISVPVALMAAVMDGLQGDESDPKNLEIAEGVYDSLTEDLF